MQWIYQAKNWTDFTWDTEAIAYKLSEIRHQQGRLLGRMENLGFELQQEATLKILTEDVIKSSAIEGETLNQDEVRSSIARKLGMDIGGLVYPTRNVEGIVEITLDATQNFSKPLTKERLFSWHSALFPTGRSGLYPIMVGDWRTDATRPMQVISGAFGREKVHFEAPSADKIDAEISQFIDWFESTQKIDSIIKAGIAHFWFVTIHPFEDGNGRIARAIADMALARSDKIPERFYSLSSQIEAERKTYYKKLESQQRGTSDISLWLEWFLDCVENALLNADRALNRVLFKAKLWAKINLQPTNERQTTIINRMLDEQFKGFMNTSKYAKLAKCSTDTALRDIQNLTSRKIFIQNRSGGRSTSYRIYDLDDL